MLGGTTYTVDGGCNFALLIATAAGELLMDLSEKSPMALRVMAHIINSIPLSFLWLVAWSPRWQRGGGLGRQDARST